MLTLKVRTDFKEVYDAFDRLPREVGDRAMASALNKSVDQAKTQMQREITAEFNVSAAYVRERLRVRRASANGQHFQAALIGGAANGRRSANIIAFVEKSVSLAQARRRAKQGTLTQLHVKVKRQGGLKPLPGAFIGNKGRTVFQRVGRERLPIKPVQVIDVAQMFNTKRINAQVVAMINRKFPEIFAREAAYFLQRWPR